MVKTIKEILSQVALESNVVVNGWVRSKRESKEVLFIDLYDGSQQGSIQIVGNPQNVDISLRTRMNAGACVRVHGILKASQGSGQAKEVHAQQIEIIGDTAEDFPLQPKRHTLEFLRTIPHLRFRASTFRAIFRIRHRVCEAIHRFFDKKGFIYLHTPIITTADAEGAGELFSIANVLGKGRPFFGKPAYLTVSGQLAAEMATIGLGRVYTFSPTFRAENSNTTRHLAEFWMVEPEMAFVTLEDIVDLAEAFVQDVVKHIVESCPEEIAFLSKQEKFKKKRPDLSLEERLSNIYTQPFVRMTYTEAIEILKRRKGKNIKFPIDAWGPDLQTEHEQYLVRKVGRPVIVTDYPKAVKAFYMRQNKDGKSVAAMDVLLPSVGEVIGGSQREERGEKLIKAMEEKGMDADKMTWYMESRRFGSVPHGGFGLGLDRLVQCITGMDNIRDVVPFPRTPGYVEG